MTGISVTNHTYDPNPVWHPLPWESIRDLLSVHVYGAPGDEGKKAQCLFSPTRFDGGKRKEHAQEITFGVLDLDDISQERLGEIVAIAAPYAAIAFTTWNHVQAASRNLVRARLCVPISRPCTPQEWPGVHSALTQFFGGSADPNCKDPSRMYFIPSLPQGAEWAAWNWRSRGTQVWEVRTAPMGQAQPLRPANDPADTAAVRRWAKRLSLKEDPFNRRMGNLILRGLDGWALSETHGERNQTLWEVAGWIGHAFPSMHPLGVAEMFRGALSNMQEQGSTQTVESFAAQISRRQDVVRAEKDVQIATSIVPVGDWREDLFRTKDGDLAPTAPNAMRILKQDPAWHGVFAYDELRQQPIFLNPPPSHKSEEEIEDSDMVEIAAWLDKEHKTCFSSAIIREAMHAASYVRRVNPVVDWLDGLVWDGKDRIGTWLTDYCGAEDTYINRVFGAKWLIAAVARAYEPGCQADNALLLKGEQDIKKTRFLRKLASERWFATLGENLADKDAQQNLRGKWIIELSELEAVKKASINAVKRFLSETADHYRASYAHYAKTIPRRCIFVGTTNEDNPLADHTGDRRFWPVEVYGANADLIEQDREQLWAEAAAMYRANVPWWLDDAEKVLAKEVQNANRAADAWEYTLAAMLRLKDGPVTIAGLLSELGVVASRIGTSDAMRISRCLRALKWRAKGLEWYRGPGAEGRKPEAPTLRVVSSSA